MKRSSNGKHIDLRVCTTPGKRPGSSSSEDDEITVHAAYYIVGENIYKAPTLADILCFRVVGSSSLGPWPASQLYARHAMVG